MLRRGRMEMRKARTTRMGFYEGETGYDNLTLGTGQPICNRFPAGEFKRKLSRPYDVTSPRTIRKSQLLRKLNHQRVIILLRLE